MKAILKRDFSKNSFWVYPPRMHDFSGINFSIYSAGYEEIGPTYFLKRSDFYCNMVTYVKKNSCTLIYDGKKYQVEEGSFIIINCMKEHILYPSEDGMIIYFFHVENNIINNFAEYLMKKYSSPILKSTHDDEAENKVQTLLTSIKTNPNDHESQSIAFYDLLLSLRKRVEINFDDSSLYYPDTIKNTLRYIKENFHLDIDLDMIASSVGLSKFYLEKIFKKYTNSTVYYYLSQIRLKKAQELLFQSDDSIEQIAIEVGLKDSQSMIRLFKKVLGETPLQYRKRRER